MKQHFLINDINEAQAHLNIIDQTNDEIRILVGRGEFAQAETLIKEQLQSLRVVKQLQQRAYNHNQIVQTAEKLKNKGILAEVVYRGI